MEESGGSGMGLFPLWFLGLIFKRRTKIEGTAFLEGFDATLIREGQKLTKMGRLWAQVELLRDPTDRVWLRAEERAYFPSSE